MKTIRLIALLLIVSTVLVISGCGLLEKKIIVRAEGSGQSVVEVPAREGIKLTIKFMHSVQKTPVEEDLEFDGASWIVHRTRYKSQGVGLPFMESDGSFRREGDWFVMDDMERRIDRLSLRTGVGTEHEIILDGSEIKLYEQFPPGTRIDFVVE